MNALLQLANDVMDLDPPIETVAGEHGRNPDLYHRFGGTWCDEPHWWSQRCSFKQIVQAPI